MRDSITEISTKRQLAVAWGLVGFLALLAKAIIGLSIVSWQAFQYELTLAHWSVLISNIAFMAYTEGYRGFQKKFAPRMAARVKHLTTSQQKNELLLAPLFCMCLFNAPKIRIVTSYILLVAIVCLVILFRSLPQPWRGILDAGVVIGLLWGSLSIIWFSYREFLDPQYSADPELANNTVT